MPTPVRSSAPPSLLSDIDAILQQEGLAPQPKAPAAAPVAAEAVLGDVSSILQAEGFEAPPLPAAPVLAVPTPLAVPTVTRLDRQGAEVRGGLALPEDIGLARMPGLPAGVTPRPGPIPNPVQPGIMAQAADIPAEFDPATGQWTGGLSPTRMTAAGMKQAGDGLVQIHKNISFQTGVPILLGNPDEAALGVANLLAGLSTVAMPVMAAAGGSAVAEAPLQAVLGIGGTVLGAHLAGVGAEKATAALGGSENVATMMREIASVVAAAGGVKAVAGQLNKMAPEVAKAGREVLLAAQIAAQPELLKAPTMSATGLSTSGAPGFGELDIYPNRPVATEIAGRTANVAPDLGAGPLGLPRGTKPTVDQLIRDVTIEKPGAPKAVAAQAELAARGVPPEQVAAAALALRRKIELQATGAVPTPPDVAPVQPVVAPSPPPAPPVEAQTPPAPLPPPANITQAVAQAPGVTPEDIQQRLAERDKARIRAEVEARPPVTEPPLGTPAPSATDEQAVVADAAQIVKAEGIPSSTPEREALIERIIAKARRPMPEIVPVKESLYSDGKWHGAFGVPHGVTDTGQSRIAGYVYRMADGTTAGTRHESPEAAADAWRTDQETRDEEFRQALRERDDAGLRDAATYWLKDEAPAEAPTPTTITTPPPTAQNAVRVTWNEDRGSIEVKFPGKPATAILDTLKAAGFKWAKTNRVWYHARPERLTRTAGTAQQVKAAALAQTRVLLGQEAARVTPPLEAPGGPTAPEATATPRPPSAPEVAPQAPASPAGGGEHAGWQEIGKNAIGQTLYEDARGVRSYIENGVRTEEPVLMVPTRAGIQIVPRHQRDTEGEWKIAELTPAAQANGIVKAEVELKAPAPAPAPTSARTWKVGDRATSFEGTGEIVQIDRDETVPGGGRARLILDATKTFSKWTNLGGLEEAPAAGQVDVEKFAQDLETQWNTWGDVTQGQIDSAVQILKDAGIDHNRLIPAEKRPPQHSALARILSVVKDYGEDKARGYEGVPADEQVAENPTVAILKDAAAAITRAADVIAGHTGEAGPGLTATPPKPTVPTEQEPSHEVPHGPGQAAVGETGTPGADRTPDEGALGAVLPEGGRRPAPARGGRGTRPSSPSGMVEGGVPDTTRPSAESEPAEGTGAGVRPRPVVAPSGDVSDPGVRPPDYALTPERIAAIIGRGDMARARDNLDAIRTILAITRDKRYATPDEQAVLAKYVGWGASALARFLAEDDDYSWKDTERAIWSELKTLLTPEQRQALAQSTQNAHFTFDLYRPIWEALRSAGFQGGRILEPAGGTGHAFGLMPPALLAASTLNAVELEPITASILQALYPSVRVQAVGYEKARIARGTQDLIISNVPFGKVQVHDPAFAEQSYLTDSIHNYFFAKALDQVRPGGLVVFLTSRYTMDGSGQRVRKYLMEKAHFLGSLRLPNTAFDKSAKTEVITDLIVLQRLREGETARNAEAFIHAPQHQTLSAPDKKIFRSAWYDAHPDLILGTESLEGSMYGGREYTVTAKQGDLTGAMTKALAAVVPPGTYVPATTTATAAAPATQLPAGSYKTGEIRLGAKKGTIEQVTSDGALVDVTPTRLDKATQQRLPDKNGVARLVGMIGIRDALRETIRAMKDPDATDSAIKKAQAALSKAYKAFVAAHGELNKSANKRLFALDPEAANLLGLEVVTPQTTITTDKHDHPILRVSYEVTGTHDIFRVRTINAPKEVTHVDTPADALLASLGSRTWIDWSYMAGITGQSVESLQAALRASGRIFEQPDGAYVVADEYLSGDVVTKLADAEAAAEQEPTRFADNVTALRSVQPTPKTVADLGDSVVVTLGAHWVPPSDIEAFVREQLGGLPSGSVTIGVSGTETIVKWAVAFDYRASGPAINHDLAVKFGPNNGMTYDLKDLLDDALNLQSPSLGYYEGRGDDRHFVKDPNGTIAARANVEDLRGRFMQWVFEHPDIAERLVGVYNERYNRTVRRHWDGSHLTLPGLALSFPDRDHPGQTKDGAKALFPHQINAIWRGLAGGNLLLAHEVGAGKTFEMIALAMEMRRTGRARKPMIVVPTHILQQWTADILRAYPDAKLLAFDEKDLEAKKRQEAMARIAFGDWDIVLVPHSSFELLKVSDQRIIEMMQRWVDELMDAEREARKDKGKKSNSVKALAAARANIQAKIQKKLDAIDKSKDRNLTWEQLGVDALFVDEAHAFKNLYFPSKIESLRGLSRSESDKALGLYVKVQDINEQSHQRNLVLATATPIMNCPAEIFTMQRYLQPQVLAQHGFSNYDNWHSTFASALPTTEQRPDGTYQEVMRLREYRNLDLLYRMVSEVMDYVGWEDMPYLRLPAIRGGHVEVVQTEPHPIYERLRKWFADRLQNLRDTPPHVDREGNYIAPPRPDPLTGRPTAKPDNILTVMTDAKLAAVDPRLILGNRIKDFAGSRIQVAAKRMAEIYKAEAKYKGVQLVFLDVGTPKNPGPLEFLTDTTTEDLTEGGALGVEDEAAEDDSAAAQVEGDTDFYNLYDELKQALIKRGVPSKEIAYIHQAKKPAERLALFQAARDGRIRFMFASTDKGGVGMNIQDRLAAVVHIDAPRAQRPGDIRQRDGRGIRQGNGYADEGRAGVHILRFVTKGTTDEWLYGLLGTKSHFITQFMRGNVTNYKDEDPSTMSIEEAQIRATGDPRGIELITLRSALVRLNAQALAADRAISQARATVATEERAKAGAERELAEVRAWVTNTFHSMKGDAFTIDLGGTSYTKRSEANDALLAAMTAYADAERTDPLRVGVLGGLPVLISGKVYGYRQHYKIDLWLNMKGAGSGTLEVTDLEGRPSEAEGVYGQGRNLIASLLDKYQAIPDRIQHLGFFLAQTERKIATAHDVLARPPEALTRARQATERVAALEEELTHEGAARDAQMTVTKSERDKASREAGLAAAAESAEMPEADFEQPSEAEIPATVTVASRATAKAAKVAGEGNLLTRYGDGWRRVKGVKVTLAGVPAEYTFWAYKSGSHFTVVEESSGLSIATEKTRTDAVDAARERILKFGPAALAEAIAKGVANNPPKPDDAPAPSKPEGTHQMLALSAAARFVPPSVRTAAQTVQRAQAEIRATLSAPTVSHPARLTSRYLRWRLAQMTHTVDVANAALMTYRNAIEGMTVDHAAILDLADILEGVRPGPVPQWLAPWVAIRRDVFTYLQRQIADLGLEKDWHEYYLGHIWETEFKGESLGSKALRQLGIGRRPLQGPKTFLKKRTIPTMREGVEQFEKEPKTWNLVEIDLYKMEEMAKFVMGRQAREDGKRLGTWVFGSALKKPPEGLQAIPDPLGEVWAPAEITVTEAYDQLLMEGLESFIQSMGVRYTRKPTAGQSWGSTGDQTGNIKAKFGGPETVLMHEIGHLLDVKYDLYNRIAAAIKTPQFPGDKSALHELSDLATLRYEGQRPTPEFVRYTNQHTEQIANLVHAYLWAPDKAKAVAPSAYDALEDLIAANPELEPLTDLQGMRSVVLGQREAAYKLPGPMLLGRYYAPPEVVRIFKNYLTPGLGTHPFWALLRIPATAMVQAKLMLSAFHAVTITQESAAMEAARGINDVMHGRPGGVARIGAALIEPVAVVTRGLSTRGRYLQTLDPLTLAATDAVNLLLMGGGRVHQSREYTNRSMRRFVDHLRRANGAWMRQQRGKAGAEVMGAALRLLPALVEAAAYPILGFLVPTSKVGATVSQIQSQLKLLPGEPTEETLLAVASKAANLGDAVLGEVIWDNYFLPRALMSAVHMIIMAPGWRGGSAILLARGLTDPVRRLWPSQRETYTVRVPTGPGPTPPPPGGAPGTPPPPPAPPPMRTIDVKEGYWSPYTSLAIATVLVQVLVSEIYQLAHGAGHVESPMDVAYPRTGEVDRNGKPERVRLPGYAGIFYDILHRFPRSAVEYAMGGTAPLPTTVGQLWNNETRFGEEIVDPGDPLRTQLFDYTKFLAQQWEPISVSSYGRRAGTAAEKAESIMGISPAPRRVTESDAEKLMREYLGPSHQTRGQAERADLSQQLREAIRAGDTTTIANLRASGMLTRQMSARAAKQAQIPSLVGRFSRLSIEEALQVYEVMDEQERGIVKWTLRRKYGRAQIPPALRDAMDVRMKHALTLPSTAMAETSGR
jgi:N12 class adenine-specific DNA methylase